jgi:glycosyltransferase involved in cell wall biosynthesis
MKDPLFTIITVCYNSEKYIEDTLKSVLRQTFTAYEYIIIDGKSTDSTLQIIDKYQALFKDKLKFISEKDNGIYDAMNKGLKLAKGKIIGIINSDDWYENNTLEMIAQCYADNFKGVVYGLLRYYKNQQEYSILTYHHNFLTEKMLTHPTVFINRELYQQYGFFDSTYHYAADYELLLRFKKNKVEFRQLDSVLANFRLGGASSNNFKTQQEALKIKAKYGLLNTKQKFWAQLKILFKQII